MGYAAQKYKEVRFVIEDELTQCYVLIEAIGDCPIGVQGWHHKTFPASKPVIDILADISRQHDSGGDPVLWPLKHPEEK